MTATAPEPLAAGTNELVRLKDAIRALADEFRGYHNDYVANRLKELIDQ